MSEHKHSPEPWTYDESDGLVRAADGRVVCEPVSDWQEPTFDDDMRRKRANGQRIAERSREAREQRATVIEEVAAHVERCSGDNALHFANLIRRQMLGKDV